MTSIAATDAMNAALAAIHANGEAMAERLARRDADPRRNALLAMIPALEPKIVDGYYGGLAVFADVFSSTHKRRLRIRKLAMARECQIAGRYHAALELLRQAAAIRSTEKLYAAAEADAAAQNARSLATVNAKVMAGILGSVSPVMEAAE